MWNSIAEDTEALRRATEQMRTDGLAYAKAEAEYQKAKATRVLEMRTGGDSAALINLLIKGDATVNQFLMERECARVIYEADKEYINTLKTAIRVGENQLAREWQG